MTTQASTKSLTSEQLELLFVKAQQNENTIGFLMWAIRHEFRVPGSMVPKSTYNTQPDEPIQTTRLFTKAQWDTYSQEFAQCMHEQAKELDRQILAHATVQPLEE